MAVPRRIRAPRATVATGAQPQLAGGLFKGASGKLLTGGLIGIPIAMDAVSQLNQVDPNTGVTDGVGNAGGAIGSAGLGIAGAVAGFGLAGPWGAGLGSWAGSALGGRLGRGAAQTASNLFGGDEIDRQLRDQERINQAARRQRMADLPVAEAEATAMSRVRENEAANGLRLRQLEAQQQAMLATVLAGSARPMNYDTGFGAVLAGGLSGLG